MLFPVEFAKQENRKLRTRRVRGWDVLLNALEDMAKNTLTFLYNETPDLIRPVGISSDHSYLVKIALFKLRNWNIKNKQ